MENSTTTNETTDISPLSELQRSVIDFFVDGAKVLGMPGSLGEIYGLLFISAEPLSLNDLVNRLGISKGSVSQGLRTLQGLGAIHSETPRTSRRTYYRPATELKKLVGGYIKEQIRPHLSSGEMKLQKLREQAEATQDPETRDFFLIRLEKLESWIGRSRKVLPLLQKILGQ